MISWACEQNKKKKKEREEEDGLNFDREERKKMAREREKEKVIYEVVVCVYWKRGKITLESEAK